MRYCYLVALKLKRLDFRELTEHITSLHLSKFLLYIYITDTHTHTNTEDLPPYQWILWQLCPLRVLIHLPSNHTTPGTLRDCVSHRGKRQIDFAASQNA